ncbi:hypothetical protein PV327_009038 [Microctonus hyperodae]|uniref:SAM-dependent MTase RsmB/NOP-type domain-containing protein n=1 Tax=Microctonus hyperodae TaxID=165561 RepID=A0AA39FSY4_MICHY|nr:hypothetical protein PV327_009038 [Microctonus hyperodae]
MSEGFKHSVKVPRLYKAASNIVKRVVEDGESLKQLIYNQNHPNIKAIYALATTTLQHATELNEIVRKTNLFFKEPRFDPWLARVLISELFWGKRSLKANAIPIQIVLKYENELREELKKIDETTRNSSTIINKAAKPRYVRINTLKITVDEAINNFYNEGYTLLSQSKNYEEFLAKLHELTEYTYIQDFHMSELFAFAPGTQFHNYPGYISGAIVLQDKASCLPAHLLNPPPNSVVLDMCAAPGMKTTHLAAKIQNNGIIYSVEMNARRYNVLCNQIESTNATCVKTINADAMTLTCNNCPDVEYILVDPSCSGSGMERLECDNTDGKCAPLRLKSLQSFQVMLLRHALLNFPNVKRVVYSTCSIYPEENEMVVDEILSDIGDAYKLIPIKSLLNNEWINFSSNEFKCRDNCLYAKSNVDMTNGFFVAVFERNFEVSLPEYKRHSRIKEHDSSAMKINENSSVEETKNSNVDDNFKSEKKRKKKKREKLTENLLNDEKEPDVNLDEPAKKKKKKKKEKNN